MSTQGKYSSPGKHSSPGKYSSPITIALIDYGIGNLRSVQKALAAVGAQVELTSSPEIILKADKVVLPGVGAFGDGMAGLRQRGLIEPLQQIVDRGVPLLGICLGMQLLFESSEEQGQYSGLGFLPGRVRLFPKAKFGQSLKIPQTGWNQVIPLGRNTSLGSTLPLNHLVPDYQVIPDHSRELRFPSVLTGLEPGSYAYFNHSYYCEPTNPQDILATTEYGLRYASVVGRGRLYGVQFHPEKSQHVGLLILRNFVEAG